MTSRRKILLVDDLQTFLETEKSFFSREEFDLLTAQNGRDALELIQCQRPDLVFMDLLMPEMAGDECCRAVKDDPELAATPIVILTTAEDASGLQRCHDCGCDEVLLKPVNRDKILAAVHRFLTFSERNELRYAARLRVRYGEDELRLLTDYTVNINSGGLFLETREPLPIDTPLRLEFQLPGRSAAIRCQGRVAWVNLPDHPKKPGFPAGMGVQMTDLGLDEVHAIREFLKDQSLVASW